jgi:hypothetical protein
MVTRNGDTVVPIPDSAGYALAAGEHDTGFTFSWISNPLGSPTTPGQIPWKVELKDAANRPVSAPLQVPETLVRDLGTAGADLQAGWLEGTEERLFWLQEGNARHLAVGVRLRPFLHERSPTEVGSDGLVGTGTNWTALLSRRPAASPTPAEHQP